ncbi:hypothetical protein HDU79_004446 [Rhizoclosmatium sp. JEL0117]|nr:hypothetical protein HDU79_004446 [Rhizoclosmatium sp. JEL0117]
MVFPIRLKALLHRCLSSLLFALAFPFLSITETGLAIHEALTAPGFNPKDEVCIVTGASSGIGEAIAYKLAAKQAKLVLVARRKDALEKVGAKCRSLGASDVRCHVADVSNEDDVKRFVVETGSHFGKIDLLILNAGISFGLYARDCTSIEPYTQVMATNQNGFVAGIIHALPYLKKARKGRVVGVSSLLGLVGGPTRTGYCASKFAMKGFLDAIRLEEPSLFFTMVYPGVVKTEINRTRVGPKGDLDMNDPNIMMPDEAADLVLDAVERGTRDQVFTFQGNFMYFFKDVFPRVRDMLVAAKARKMIKATEKKE